MSSDSAEEQVVEINLALKRKAISSKHKAIKRVMKRLRALQATRQPMLISLQSLQTQEEELETLHRRANKCQAILTDEEVDMDLQNLDEEAYLNLEASLDEAASLAKNW